MRGNLPFDDIVARAARLCQAPMAVVAVVDDEHRWTRVAVGLADPDAIDGLCALVARETGTTIVRETAAAAALDGDEVRFCAGVPLIDGHGRSMGALCVLDRHPRTLEPWQVEVLEVLGRQVVSQLRLDAIEHDHAGVVDDLELARHDLSFLTTHDALTGLANRQTFREALDGFASSNHSGTASTALVLIDIDDFNEVNDRLGHDAGDRVLVTIADRINLGCRGDDLVARLAGDQFVVLLRSAGALGPESLARRLLQTIAAPIDLRGATVSVTASIGIAQCDAGVTSGDELMRATDVAMRNAKEHGGNRWADAGTHPSGPDGDADLGSFVRMVLDEHRLRVELRPLRSLPDGDVVAYDAALRWDVPGGEAIDGPAFVSAAGALRLGGQVTRFAIGEACRAVARRRLMGEIGAAVVVGLPASQLEHDEVLLLVATAIIDHDLDPSALILQLTEAGALMASEAARTTLRELQNMGVRSALADFGTGLSSLALLETFAFDFMRVDGSFLAARTETDRDVLRSLVQLGHHLGMVILAETADRPGVFDWLRAAITEPLEHLVAATPH
ncbi:MAG: diguanylate cyclase [Ilumatobacteraceae bacterium]